MNGIGIQSLPQGVKAILLDFDNTLYHYPLCHENAMQRCFREYCDRVETVPADAFHQMYAEAKRAVKGRVGAEHAASHSRFLYFQELFEKRLCRTDAALTCEFERLYWASFFEQIRLRPWAMDLLKGAKDAGIAVCVITNLTARIQFEKIMHCGLAEWVDYIVSSEGAGVEKPDPRIFELALQKLRLRPEDVVMVGDSLEHDAEGAKRLGIRFLHVDIES